MSYFAGELGSHAYLRLVPATMSAQSEKPDFLHKVERKFSTSRQDAEKPIHRAGTSPGQSVRNADEGDLSLGPPVLFHALLLASPSTHISLVTSYTFSSDLLAVTPLSSSCSMPCRAQLGKYAWRSCPAPALEEMAS